MIIISIIIFIITTTIMIIRMVEVLGKKEQNQVFLFLYYVAFVVLFPHEVGCDLCFSCLRGD